MPKKLNSNPKAVEARERKDTVKKEKHQAATKAADDAKWADEGQSAAEKRAREKEAKRVEELKKKEAKKEAAAKDEQEMKTVKTVKVNPHKVSQAQHSTAQCCRLYVPLMGAWFGVWWCWLLVYQVTLAAIASSVASRDAERERERLDEERRKQRLLSQDELPTENVNQLARDRQLADEAQYGRGGVISAQSLDEAVAALTVAGADGEGDRHPEKRLRAAYAEYEEAQWESLKADNPSLRHSQLKELLWRQWQKAPSNPLNQAAQREREQASSSSRSKATATS